jgi:hypothetical protein
VASRREELVDGKVALRLKDGNALALNDKARQPVSGPPGISPRSEELSLCFANSLSRSQDNVKEK